MPRQQKFLFETFIRTPLGMMRAIADDTALYFLEFIEYPIAQKKLQQLKKDFDVIIKPGTNPILELISSELEQYFAGNLTLFTTPLFFIGTPFQHAVWGALQNIPAGSTKAYWQVAHALNMHSAHRAVALANSANHLILVVPCHRVINANGSLGGYSSGGQKVKQWLLSHEIKCTAFKQKR